MELGHFGDVAPVGEGVSELRIFYGPAIESILCSVAQQLSFFISGGDKNTQDLDIAKAKELAKQVED